MSSKPRSRLLSCFSCGLAGPSRSGSGVATASITNETTSFPGSSIAGDTVCDKTKAAGEPVPEVVSRPGSDRPPLSAFGEQTRERSALPDSPVKMTINVSVAAGGAMQLNAFKVTAAVGAASRGSGGASATVAPGNAADFSGDCTKEAARRRGHKPRVSTSRVSPAYDTEDELSPAAGISRTPSGSAGGSSSPTYSASLPSLEAPLVDDGAQVTDTDANPGSVAALKHGGSSFTIEDKAAGRLPSRPTAAGGSLSRMEHVLHPSAVCSESFKISESSASSKSAAGVTGSVLSRPAAVIGSVPNVAAALARSNNASRSEADSRSLSPASCTVATIDAITGDSSSSSNGERPGPGHGCGGGDEGAVGNLVSEPDSPRAAFPGRAMDCPSATAAVVTDTTVISGQLAVDDSTSHSSGGGGGSAAVRRSSFAGDSSTSLVGPGSVSEPPLQHCPSLCITTSNAPKPQEQQHERKQQQQQTLSPSESVRLSPLPPPPPPPTLQTYGSLRLNPLPPPRQLTTSPSLRPTPLLLPSPSMSQSAPQQLLLSLPGSQSMPESAPARMSTSGDTMLRLPPAHQPLFQHGPCSFARSPYPRPHALAPLVRAPVTEDDPSALTRLTSLQAAFREKRLHEEEESQPGGADGDGGCTTAAATTATGGTSKALTTGGHRRRSDTDRAEKRTLEWRDTSGATAFTAATIADDRAVAAAAVPKSFEFDVVVAAAAGAGDTYDGTDFCGDDVDSMVEQLLPPSSSYRSSSPGCGPDMNAKDERQQQRMASPEQQQPRPLPPPMPLHAAGTGSGGGAAAVAVDDGALVTEMVSEPQPEALLGAYAPKWLEELLPPSPGYGAERPSTRIGGARPKHIIVAAPDSFRNLLREIE